MCRLCIVPQAGLCTDWTTCIFNAERATITGVTDATPCLMLNLLQPTNESLRSISSMSQSHNRRKHRRILLRTGPCQRIPRPSFVRVQTRLPTMPLGLWSYYHDGSGFSSTTCFGADGSQPTLLPRKECQATVASKEVGWATSVETWYGAGGPRLEFPPLHQGSYSRWRLAWTLLRILYWVEALVSELHKRLKPRHCAGWSRRRR